MNSLVERLRDYQESWADSIKRMDYGEFGDNGIMSQIRTEQHATWKEAADLIEQQSKRIKGLEAKLATLRKRIDDAPVVAEVTHEGGAAIWHIECNKGTKLISLEDLK